MQGRQISRRFWVCSSLPVIPVFLVLTLAIGWDFGGDDRAPAHRNLNQPVTATPLFSAAIPPASKQLPVGDPAADFTLMRIADGRPMRLAQLCVEKPAVLIFSSFT